MLPFPFDLNELPLSSPPPEPVAGEGTGGRGKVLFLDLNALPSPSESEEDDEEVERSCDFVYSGIAMNRRIELSKAYTRKAKNEANELDCCSFTDLPAHVLYDILLRLPVKGIAICKCVCKTLHDIISHPEFTKLHFSQQEVYPIIRTFDASCVSRILYHVQLEQDRDFTGRFSCQHCNGKFVPSCDCQVDIRFDFKLKLPLRNASTMLCLSLPSYRGRIKVKPEDHKYKIVNSCNGFLCLSEPSNNPVVVCNPVTGEFINLPKTREVKDYHKRNEDCIDCGLGFSPITNRYKVVRIFEVEEWSHLPDPITGELIYSNKVAEVHTLGTGSWIDIGPAPYSSYSLTFPTYLHGAIHWLFFGSTGFDPVLIVSFDMDKECFNSVPPPPLTSNGSSLTDTVVGLGVLGGCLCICEASRYHSIHLWVMKDYGVRISWTEVFSISDDCGEMGLYQPIKYLNNGAILMFQYPNSVLVYYDPKELLFRYFKVQGVDSQFEVITYTPSFVSLKDVIAGDSVHVLSISSSGDEVKLQGEVTTVSLMEEISDLEELRGLELYYDKEILRWNPIWRLNHDL